MKSFNVAQRLIARQRTMAVESRFLGTPCFVRAMSTQAIGGVGSPVFRRHTTPQCASCSSHQQRRWLNLHEYQSKQLLREHGLQVQRGAVADTPEEAHRIAKELKETGAEDVILKAQVMAGGRGKGHLSSGLRGGVQICKTPEQVLDFAKQMLGFRISTHQTTSRGELVQKVLVLEGVNIEKELYLAIVLDRAYGGPVVVASRMGGMDIEEIAAKDPHAITMVPIDISRGMRGEDAVTVAKALGFGEDGGSQQCFPLNVTDQIQRLYKLMMATDAVQVEINPLAVTDKCPDYLVCVDAKISFDDNAKFRQGRLFEMEDKSTMDPREIAAESAGLNFVGMDGNIGCLVNGAGLAMATMDIIQLHGGEPANFLDVGGGASVEQVTEAFKVLKSDRHVQAVFINIFGGIMRCDIVAKGLVEAVKAVDLSIPLVVRLVGNRVEEAKALLGNSGIRTLEMVDDFDAAASRVCAVARECVAQQ